MTEKLRKFLISPGNWGEAWVATSPVGVWSWRMCKTENNLTWMNSNASFPCLVNEICTYKEYSDFRCKLQLVPILMAYTHYGQKMVVWICSETCFESLGIQNRERGGEAGRLGTLQRKDLKGRVWECATQFPAMPPTPRSQGRCWAGGGVLAPRWRPASVHSAKWYSWSLKCVQHGYQSRQRQIFGFKETGVCHVKAMHQQSGWGLIVSLCGSLHVSRTFSS